MEKNRVAKCSLTAAVLVFSAARALGSGGWFEEAPPPLPFYLHRLPAKTIEEIYRETTPPASPRRYVDFPDEVKKLAAEIAHQDRQKLREKIDDWLAIARARDNAGYWSGGAFLTLLIDLREALNAEGATVAELADYCRWRVEHADWFGLQIKPGEPEPRRYWAGDQAGVPWDSVAEIDQRAAKASPALAAHWIYLHGALEFKSGEDIDSQRWFKRVLDEFPESPRAEAAAFMNARCALSQSRSYDFNHPGSVIVSDPAKRHAAEVLLDDYLKKYPHGSFAPDAIGWRGALAFDAQDYGKALPFYIRQTEMRDHPELLKPALIMCERVLEHLGAEPDDGAFAEIARTPRVAMAMIYMIVNATEADNFDGKFDEVDRVKQWRKNILPRLARAVAAEKSAYTSPEWKPRFLAILAEAASGGGDQGEALRLTENAGESKNDDLLMARGVALQRASRLSDAIETFYLFLKKFPHSPLARGARLRLATALQDDHRAGFAVVELSRLAAANDSTQSEEDTYEYGYRPADVSDAEPAQIAQLLDTLLNFAPLAELATPLGDPNLENELRLTLSQTLAERWLARENFVEAKKFMTPAEWGLQAAEMEKLSANAKGAKPGENRVRALFALGERWARARRKLLAFPLDSEESRRQLCRGFAASANLQRRENARALFGKIDADAEMESRDELRHAFDYWLKAAAEQPASPLAAQALWHALNAICEMANVSPYTLQRAVETDASGVSKKLYERLLRECPGSREAKELAVYWNFTPLKTYDNLPEPRRFYTWDENSRAAFLGTEERRWPDHNAWRPLINRMIGLDSLADTPDMLAAEVSDLGHEARALHKSIDEAFLLNFLDDVALFLERPNLEADARRRYLALRIECLRRSAWEDWSDELHVDAPEGVDLDQKLRDEIRAAQKEPRLKAAADFVDFLDLAVVANHLIDVKAEGVEKDGEPVTYRSRDYALLEKMTSAFLAKFRESPKREAALLLHTRAIFMLSRPVYFKKWVAWPEANRMEGSFPPQFHQREAFKPARVLAALDDYERAYPNGKYEATIRSYRAEVFARTHEWARAFEITLGLLNDENAQELHEEAAVRLAKIFEQLADENERAKLLALIKASPELRGYLKSFLKIESEDHPLIYLKQYLADQIHERLED